MRDDACQPGQSVMPGPMFEGRAPARVQGIERLNMRLETEQTGPVRIAMALHAGAAVVGDMGYGQAVGLAAIGDGRLGLDPADYEQRLISGRGRVAPVVALVVPEAHGPSAAASLSDRAGRNAGSEAKGDHFRAAYPRRTAEPSGILGPVEP